MIYLDNNSTTRPSEGALRAAQRACTELWQNPSSIHRGGQAARHAVELARRDTARLIGASPGEIVFTGSGTESIDLAIRGIVDWSRGPLPVVSTPVEHAAVRDLLADLARRGAIELRLAGVDRFGVVRLGELEALLPGARLATVQWANNETGAIQPIAQIARLCAHHGVTFHTDATQWVGKMPTDVKGLPVDLLTFSPHKFHGLKGVGVLYVRSGVRLEPAIHGVQEMGRRGGTENVPGILAAGVACIEAREWLSDPIRAHPDPRLRDALERAILERVPGTRVNGPADARLWNTTNIAFDGVEAEAMLIALSERGVAASAGAACSSGSLDPSPVLLAMGLDEAAAGSSVRFSLSRETTQDEVEQAGAIIADVADALRRG